MVFLTFNQPKGMLIEPVQPVHQTPFPVEKPKGIEQCVVVELHFILGCRNEQDFVDDEPSVVVVRGFHPLQDFEKRRRGNLILMGHFLRFGIHGCRFGIHR